MRVLLTGGAGFLGSNVFDALRARGDDLIVVDDLATGDRANLPADADLRIVDIADARALASALAGARFNAVVHCASRTKVVESMERPELYRRVILDGTSNVIERARAASTRRFVNISTGGALYGETPRCADESRPLDAPSNYGTFKAQAEKAVAASRLGPITLRIANIYGPRQRRDLEGGVIAIFVGCWRRGEALTVFGDGTAQRDYVYVGDVAEAVVAALASDREGTYNIGTGVATSVNELVAAMTEVLGPPRGIVHAPPRSVELQRSCIDASKAARDGLWRPRTSLREGLRKTAGA